jgi:hypothetical protein
MLSLLRRVMYGSNKLRGYERSCTMAFSAHLDTGARAILEKQIETVEIIQRFSKDRMVVLHFCERNPDLFPDLSRELTAGRVKLSGGGTGRTLRCDLVFDEGRISSLEFSESPRILKGREVVIKDVTMYADLQQPPAARVPADEAQVGGPLLERVRERYELRDVIAPATQPEIEVFLSRLGNALPGDFRDLLLESNGFSVGEFEFRGTNARRIMGREDDYYLLAETQERALCVKERRDPGQVFLLDQIDEAETPLSGSFVDSLLEVVGGQPDELG